MAFTRIGGATVTSSSVSTLTLSGYAGTSADNLVVITLNINSSRTVTSVSDNVGNTYDYSLSLGSGSSKIYAIYGVQTIAGATSFTIVLDASSTIFKFNIDEFSGGQITNASIYDTSTSASGFGSTPGVGITPTASGELICLFTINSGSNTYTPPSGFTVGSSQSGGRLSYKLSGGSSEAGIGAFIGNPFWFQVDIAFFNYVAPSNTFNPIMLAGD